MKFKKTGPHFRSGMIEVDGKLGAVLGVGGGFEGRVAISAADAGRLLLVLAGRGVVEAREHIEALAARLQPVLEEAKRILAEKAEAFVDYVDQSNPAAARRADQAGSDLVGAFRDAGEADNLFEGMWHVTRRIGHSVKGVAFEAQTVGSAALRRVRGK